MERIFVKPKPGGPQVRRPEPPYAHVPPEGLEVPDGTWWRRRAADGDLELLEQPVAPPPEPPVTKKGGSR